MSHSSQLHRTATARVCYQQPRKLAFEFLEDRRVLASLYGPEPLLDLSNGAPEDCLIGPVNASDISPQSALQNSCSDAEVVSRLRRWINVSINLVVAESLTSSTYFLAEGSGNSNLGSISYGYGAAFTRGFVNSTAHRVVEPQFSPIQGPLRLQSQDAGKILGELTQQSPAFVLDTPSGVAGQSPPVSLFSPNRSVDPLLWNGRDDATHALQPKFLVGSNDSSTERSRSLVPSAWVPAQTDLVRLLPSSETGVADRRTRFSTGRNDRQAGLELLTRLDSSNADRSGKNDSSEPRYAVLSGRSWSRLASALHRVSRENGTERAATSHDATDMARDVLFAELADQEADIAVALFVPNSVPQSQSNRKPETSD